ncbi:hypothetical protein F4778DRAFT_779126 [Xylariomycetidae sp. FL2044]|nr:hypothetical protein F4778DRAFT_779126 [Xylariomycetidae sp. FL2044]
MAGTEEERMGVVADGLVNKVARVMSMAADGMQKDKPLYAFGVDSLVAIELRNWIKSEFAAQIPIYEITGGKSIELIARLICKASEMRYTFSSRITIEKEKLAL